MIFKIHLSTHGCCARVWPCASPGTPGAGTSPTAAAAMYRGFRVFCLSPCVTAHRTVNDTGIVYLSSPCWAHLPRTQLGSPLRGSPLSPPCPLSCGKSCIKSIEICQNMISGILARSGRSEGLGASGFQFCL